MNGTKKILFEKVDEKGQSLRMAYCKGFPCYPKDHRPFYRCEVKLSGDNDFIATGKVVFQKEHAESVFKAQCLSWGF